MVGCAPPTWQGSPSGSFCITLRGFQGRRRQPKLEQVADGSLEGRAPVAQLDRVPGYEPGGREFESLRARQSIKNLRALRIASPELFTSGSPPQLVDMPTGRAVQPAKGL